MGCATSAHRRLRVPPRGLDWAASHKTLWRRARRPTTASAGSFCGTARPGRPCRTLRRRSRGVWRTRGGSWTTELDGRRPKGAGPDNLRGRPGQHIDASMHRYVCPVASGLVARHARKSHSTFSVLTGLEGGEGPRKSCINSQHEMQETQEIHALPAAGNIATEKKRSSPKNRQFAGLTPGARTCAPAPATTQECQHEQQLPYVQQHLEEPYAS